ncbi:SRPBCC family protein [Promicromonospora sp. MS192]|uniref:SRPBCC family protein n=1 Tax=Promicromonospora sp. MS192 TaxID=3412684 RepID=UPI003C2D6D44
MSNCTIRPVRQQRHGRRLAASAVAAGVVSYAWWVKRGHDRWGATDAEVMAVLPGDGLVPGPATQVTRAITIDAPPRDVWPWVVQIGADRGGFYSYAWLENLFGLGIHNAQEVVEEWQDLRVGDVVRATRARGGGWYVVDLVPGVALVLQIADLDAGRPVRRTDPAGWEFLWTFALRETKDGRTRLLLRERVAFGRPLVRLLTAPLGEVSYLMSRRTLHGIKERVEGRASG